ncbi:zinc fingers and homeoboxes protein 1-like [Xyrauchen texanus]|uniref:zinc fingers and homeoboxes protein 1-like n=1 Tax=Xyrauchen texanus TaxID=154827 RepID=UPI0022418A23|nr:zinc fingers and homeoboxes protein 1-like [Xyrauchen texanus]
MEQCAAPLLEGSSTRASPSDPVTCPESPVKNTGQDAVETAKDAYECRICGYKALGVKCLSQHLHVAHPVTNICDLNSVSCEEDNTQEECVDDGETPCLNGEINSPQEKSSVKDKPIIHDESKSTSLQNPENLNETSSSMDAQEQDETMEVSPAPKTTESFSPVLPQEKSPCSSVSKQACQKRQKATSGTSTHNKTNLVCLPLVSDGLKLIWVRSEQIHELDAMSELVEAFNEFPYPTLQEVTALARRCALPPEQVKAWFMMQRVRYGISWGDDDIQETRRKLWCIQKRSLAEECEEVNDEEDELQDYLENERSLDGQQQANKQSPAAEAHIYQRDHMPKSSHTVPHPSTNDQHRFDVSQYNKTPQSNNGVQQLLNSNIVYNNGVQLSSQVPQVITQFQSESRNLTPHNTGVQLIDACGQSQYMIINDQHTATSYHLGPHQLPELSNSLQSLPGKKSKAQLMALRRSFVRKSWPTDAEVEHLQRVTGLNRREIRKWFADSRYQLRRNGRAWIAKLAKRNRSSQQTQQNSQSELENDVLPESTDAGFEVDVGEDEEGADNQSVETREEVSDDGEFDDSNASIQQNFADLSPSPSAPPSFTHGRVESSVRLRKKTREQLEILRQSFLRCQWPTSNDYMILQQKTGLTRTEIIQWYGDTRYHIKHNQMRWMTSQERQHIIEVITQQQKRGGKYSRARVLMEGMGSGLSLGNPPLINGVGGGEVATWNDLFRGSTPVLP